MLAPMRAYGLSRCDIKSFSITCRFEMAGCFCAQNRRKDHRSRKKRARKEWHKWEMEK